MSVVVFKMKFLFFSEALSLANRDGLDYLWAFGAQLVIGLQGV